MQSDKTEKLDTMRMKDIVAQLTDVIYLLCDAKGQDIMTIMNQFTDMTHEERERLHISYSREV